jgi:hypothetical protein
MEEIRKVCSSLEWMLASSACGKEQIWELLETKAKQSRGKVCGTHAARHSAAIFNQRDQQCGTPISPLDRMRAGNSLKKQSRPEFSLAISSALVEVGLSCCALTRRFTDFN